MKVSTQLLSVKKSGKGEAVIVFGCAVDSIKEVIELTEDVSINMWIEGAKSETIKGFVSSCSVNSSSNASKSKFTVKCPESESIKTSQLSTLCGREVELNIEMDVD